MKRTIIFILTTMLCVGFSYADTKATIYTKGGKAIEVIICTEMPSSQIKECNEYYRAKFPNATLLADASARYNCHSYAWNLSDGGDLV